MIEIKPHHRKFEHYLATVTNEAKEVVKMAYEAVKIGFPGQEGMFRKIECLYPHITIYTNDGIDYYVI